ncbi:arylamine N-acetyltransferase [Streptomyces sp. NA04227]|uniref:arylamine N-acetyltransferase family protein n=1 Tax=Streptomyces sp. NA04227 TaxID=2742136 RepID=UPI0020CA6241|nr:arylamine N-acetyltransferase [Streptomyces sp. NA04227]
MSVFEKTRWEGELLDAEAYFGHIGYEGERAPTLGVLRALHRAHVTALPWENFNAVLGKPIGTDLATVQEKFLREGRGGYCYEHNVLFAAVLERLGYRFTALHGRITLGADKVLPATHALLAVRTADDERTWLCDVGFGSGPLEPLELRDGTEAEFDGWRYRLVRNESTATVATLGHGDEKADVSGLGDWWLHQYGPDGWIDRSTFTLNPQYPIDYVVGNHFVATHPRSPFTRRLFAQRFTAARAEQLDNAVWSTTLPDGTKTERTIEPAELRKILREVFDIELAPEDAAALEQSVVRNLSEARDPSEAGERDGE